MRVPLGGEKALDADGKVWITIDPTELASLRNVCHAARAVREQAVEMHGVDDVWIEISARAYCALADALDALEEEDDDELA